jgi:hypothetical protein
MFATYCHCTRCQRRTGCGASAEARLVPGSLRVVEGADLVNAYEPPSGGWHELFCSNCGSALFSRDPDDPEKESVSLGAFDGDPGVRPSARQFTSYAAVWERLPDDGLERFPESSRG